MNKMDFEQCINDLTTRIDEQKARVEQLMQEHIKQRIPGCTSVSRRGMGHFFGTLMEDRRRGADVMQELCLNFDNFPFNDTYIPIKVEILRWSSSEVKRVLFFIPVKAKIQTFALTCNWLFHDTTDATLEEMKQDVDQIMMRAKEELGEYDVVVQNIHTLLWNNRKILGFK